MNKLIMIWALFITSFSAIGQTDLKKDSLELSNLSPALAHEIVRLLNPSSTFPKPTSETEIPFLAKSRIVGQNTNLYGAKPFSNVKQYEIIELILPIQNIENLELDKIDNKNIRLRELRKFDETGKLVEFKFHEPYKDSNASLMSLPAHYLYHYNEDGSYARHESANGEVLLNYVADLVINVKEDEFDSEKTYTELIDSGVTKGRKNVQFLNENERILRKLYITSKLINDRKFSYNDDLSLEFYHEEGYDLTYSSQLTTKVIYEYTTDGLLSKCTETLKNLKGDIDSVKEKIYSYKIERDPATKLLQIQVKEEDFYSGRLIKSKSSMYEFDKYNNWILLKKYQGKTLLKLYARIFEYN